MDEFPTLPPAPGATEEAWSRTRRWPTFVVVVVVLATVAAIVVTVETADMGPAATGRSPALSAGPAHVAAPRGLHAEEGSFSVVLTWGLRTAGAAPSGFRIYRDGRLVETIGASERSFQDDEVLPSTTYRYEVEAFDDTGGASAGDSLSVETTTPSLDSTRLAGVFDVRMTKTSSYGVADIPPHATAAWRFTPRCDEGECDVSWRYIGFAGLSVVLEREGDTYTGSSSARGFLTCQGTDSLSTYEVTLRVVRARALRGEWRAGALRGTLTVHNAAQLGCRASNVSYSLAATLVR